MLYESTVNYLLIIIKILLLKLTIKYANKFLRLLMI